MNVVDIAEVPAEDPSKRPDATPDETTRWRGSLSRFRWPLMMAIAALIFSIGHGAGAYQKEEEILKTRMISAEKFEVRGPDGKLRASLAQGKNEGAILSFYDESGRSRLIIGTDAKGTPSISFLNDKDKGAPKMLLSVDPNDGTPQIILFDDHGAPTVHLGLVKGFGPDLSLGKVGQGRISLYVTEKGDAAIQLLDPKNHPRLSLSVADAGPSISLLDDNQAVRATWRVLPDGTPDFSLSDRHSRERLVVTTDKDGRPSIRFVDPDTKTFRELR